MARVVLNRHAVEAGHLPDICLCCGAPATSRNLEEFKYRPTWVLMIKFLPSNYSVWTSGYSRFPAPFCEAHKSRLWLPFKARMAMLAAIALGGFCLIMGLLLMALSQVLGVLVLLGIPLMILTVLGLNTTAFWLDLKTPRAVEIKGDVLTLEPVPENFAYAVQHIGHVMEETSGMRWAPAAVAGHALVPLIGVSVASFGCLLSGAMHFMMEGGNAAPVARGNGRVEVVQPREPKIERSGPRNPNSSTNSNNSQPSGNNQGSGHSSAQNTPAPPAEMTIPAVLSDISSGTRSKSDAAFAWLKQQEFDASQQASVNKSLVQALSDRDKASKSLDLLAKWATAAQLPAIADVAKSSQNPTHLRREALATLAAIKDPTIAPEIAPLLKDFGLSSNVKSALIALGPTAAPAVAPYFNAEDSTARNNAREILRQLENADDLILAQIVTDLAKGSNNERRNALEYLKDAPIAEAYRAQIATQLNSLLTEKDLRSQALAAIRKWGGPENTDALVALLDLEKSFEFRDIANVLAQLGDPRAAEPIATGIPKFFTRRYAIEALETLGPAAEAAVVPYLADNDRTTAREAAKLMGQIATTRSKTLLAGARRNAVSKGWKDVDEALAAALAQAQTRQPPGEIDGQPTTPLTDAEFRTWSDASGSFRIEAAFVDFSNGKASLKKPDGAIISISPTKLSDVDRTYIQETMKRRGS
ncbi:SHD1 domain-containing protein [Lignipirellula cremea]|uniref:SLA1 homology domain-containing protein n=1 Tax=Lignipirellula cremea TaxID=2528010 RepID=A0A518DTW5_9BACT|nr:SHD1 domain-containing protein [Lignipirellula cremea]QDU95274.1 hypothetical protein Pla8534_30890 [Lignipirellula cremea]